MKKIYIAGAGLVVRPLVKYLLDQPGFQIEVAAREPAKAEKMIGSHPRGKAVKLDIHDEAGLAVRIAGADLVISMIPYVFHPMLGKICIAHKKPLVTASYISPAMKALDEEAKREGVILLNELGLDPGIDHMEAMRIIHGIKAERGQIESFVSYCGALPAPEANTNPFGYKFSWSPKGVLLAGKNSARFLEDGKIVSVPSEKLFESYRIFPVPGLGNFEAYPNRDSVPYAEAYGIQETKTMLRGTLRYPGWCLTMKKFGDLGLFDQTEKDFSGMTYAGFMKKLAYGAPGEDLKKALARALNIEPGSEVIKNMAWLGLLSEKLIGAGKSTAIDILAGLMIEKLQYKEGERDMIILQHIILAVRPNGVKEKITSTLIDYGIPHGDSSTSRTVGLSAAIGARFILEGKIRLTGVRAPIEPEIYAPILDELKNQGVEFKEKRTTL